jgi:large subunit ribosomal protein L21
MPIFAVIKTGGKQYKVAEGQKLRVEKLPDAESGEVVFGDVLMVSNGDDVKIGTPKVEEAKVSARVTKEGRTRKIIVFKYRAKKRYKKKAGHRQHFTEIEITKINS